MNTSAGGIRPCGGEGELAASVVLATEPGRSLPYVEQRLLARFVEHADRKVHDRAGADKWQAVMRRLFRLTAVAGRVPVTNGLALVATEDEGALLHLRAPVRDRVQVGPAPTVAELGLQAWPQGSLAVAVLSESLARAVVLRQGLLHELVGPALPLRRDPSRFVGDHLSRFEEQLLAAVEPDVPIVLAGDERITADFRRASALRDRIVGVIPGDSVATPPAQLLSRALPLLVSSARPLTVAV